MFRNKIFIQSLEIRFKSKSTYKFGIYRKLAHEIKLIYLLCKHFATPTSNNSFGRRTLNHTEVLET